MRATVIRGSGTPPCYRVALPWFGPLLCDCTGDKGATVTRVGAGCDPALGNALAALLIAVRREGNRLIAEYDEKLIAGWAVPAIPDGRGRLSFDTPFDLRTDAQAALLVLLYDRSAVVYDPRDHERKQFPDTWEKQLDPKTWEDLFELPELGYAGNPREPAWIPKLPEPMAREITLRMRDLLKKPAQELELGLIELGRREAQPEEIAFAVASCQYPAGFLDREVAQASYARLAEGLDSGKWPRLSCLLLIGDQVYIDATAGLFDPVTQYDRYELPYERFLCMTPLRQVLRRLPLYAMLDDHEIEDDWQPVAGTGRSDPGLIAGREGYLRYQRLAGPPRREAAGDSREPLWYTFECDGLPFFMADTRSEREARNAENVAAARIMSDAQFEALLRWLDHWRDKTPDVPMFVASPSVLLPRHRRAVQRNHVASALYSDSWDGYPHSFFQLLAYIAKNKIRNVVFLSGDEHLSFDCEARLSGPDGAEILVRSVHSSALYAPFPFANSTQTNLAHNETFEFAIDNYGPCRCVVTTKFVPGDGFAVICARRTSSGWSVQPFFDRA